MLVLFDMKDNTFIANTYLSIYDHIYLSIYLSIYDVFLHHFLKNAHLYEMDTADDIKEKKSMLNLMSKTP